VFFGNLDHQIGNGISIMFNSQIQTSFV
jgi:hypothetical protein